MSTNVNEAPSVTIRRDRLVFQDYSIDVPGVVNEAARWTTGSRGVQAPLTVAQGCDLSAFARHALKLGAQMLSYGADAGAVSALSGTVTQLASRAEEASRALTIDMQRAAQVAAQAAATATQEAATQTAAAVGGAAELAVHKIDGAVEATTRSIQAELARLLGGDDTPIAVAVQRIVEQQMSSSAVTLHRTFCETLGSVSATLDVGNPASPLAKLEARIGERTALQHAEVTQQLEKVREAVAVAAAAASTTAAVSAAQAASPAKGRPFEERVAAMMDEVAAGLGGTYTRVSDTAGVMPGCKKGDGVLDIPAADGSAGVRAVIEASSGANRNWNTYLADAERNREAQCSVGVVPDAHLVPGRSQLTALGSSRIVLALQESDDLGLLRAACLLLILRAQRDAALQRAGSDLGAVDARLAEAQDLLNHMTAVRKIAEDVKAGAGKMATKLEALQESMTRSLMQARAALGKATPTADVTATDEVAA